MLLVPTIPIISFLNARSHARPTSENNLHATAWVDSKHAVFKVKLPVHITKDIHSRLKRYKTIAQLLLSWPHNVAQVEFLLSSGGNFSLTHSFSIISEYIAINYFFSFFCSFVLFRLFLFLFSFVVFSLVAVLFACATWWIRWIYKLCK